MAHYVHDRFSAAGIPLVEIQPVDALLSTPVESSLEMLDSISGETLFAASLSEDILDLDTTSDSWFRNHTYNGYSPSGNVSAAFVYANYGRPEDFDALEAVGVSVEGKIVITRYGKCFRGLKAMNAQNRGAVGTIIYSDPQQDGFTKGPAYPNGAWRPASSVQRGSVHFNSLCAGDPSRAASDKTVEEVCGFSRDELVPLIPVMPISYGDAEPFLRALGGLVGPEGFQGGLNFSYTVGPSSAVVRMVVENEEHVGPVWNVVGTISGTLPEAEDRPVVLGNHRDAWAFGAVDPNSGTACLIELARGLGVLLGGGWRPLRTIILCSWSGEELGMIGSTAWGEANAEGILAKAAAYLNVDSAVSGSFLNIKATPTLAGLIEGALGDVEDPASGGTLLDAWSDHLQMLGSGSDYTVFLDRLGIASVDFAFKQDPAGYAVYHSVYDSFSWVENYGDPGFRYFQASARLWGLMALRLASPDVLPFDPRRRATALEEYLAALTPPPPSDGKRGASVSLSEDDLAPLARAIAAFRTAADEIGRLTAASVLEGIPVEAVTEARAVMLRGAGGVTGRREGGRAGATGLTTDDLNERLAMTERRFLSPEGLPGRPWYRHVLQAPGLYLGYAADSFPGITQALRDGDEALARAQVLVAAVCVTDAADFLSG
ncbi:unnamed protein product [Ascophyllum nodosum]